MLLLPRTRTSPTEITGKCSLEISEAKHHFTSKLCSQRENVTFVLRCPYPLVTIFGKPQNPIVNMHQITGCFCIQCHPRGQIILITDSCIVRIAVFGFHIWISTGTPIKIVHTGKTVVIRHATLYVESLIKKVSGKTSRPGRHIPAIILFEHILPM